MTPTSHAEAIYAHQLRARLAAEAAAATRTTGTPHAVVTRRVGSLQGHVAPASDVAAMLGAEYFTLPGSADVAACVVAPPPAGRVWLVAIAAGRVDLREVRTRGAR